MKVKPLVSECPKPQGFNSENTENTCWGFLCCNSIIESRRYVTLPMLFSSLAMLSILKVFLFRWVLMSLERECKNRTL